MVNAEPRREIVYVMSFMGYHKIGRTSNIEQRLRNVLPTAFPIKPSLELAIEVPDSRLAESLLHAEYSSKRVHGEWFHLEEGDVENISSLVGKIDFHRKRFSANRPKTEKQLSQLITNRLALESSFVPVRYSPHVLCNLKRGRSVIIATGDRAVLRSVERKFGLRLWINSPNNCDSILVTKVD